MGNSSKNSLITRGTSHGNFCQKKPWGLSFCREGKRDFGSFNTSSRLEDVFFTSPAFIFMVLLKVWEVWIAFNNLRRFDSAEILVTLRTFHCFYFTFWLRKWNNTLHWHTFWTYHASYFFYLFIYLFFFHFALFQKI